MATQYQLSTYYKVKNIEKFKTKRNNELVIYPGDILTKNNDGSYTKHTGVMLVGIIIPDNCVEKIVKKTKMIIL